MTASARQRFLTKCHFCQSRLPIRQSRDHEPATAAVASSLSRSEEQGEEAASPGNQSRSRAFLEVSPRRFAFENHRLPLALPQSSGKVRNLTFRSRHSPLQRCASQHKNRSALCRNCGR